MKPSIKSHSYVIRCTVAEFNALPAVVGGALGDCARGRIGDLVVVRRRETTGAGDCITHYPVIFTEEASHEA